MICTQLRSPLLLLALSFIETAVFVYKPAPLEVQVKNFWPALLFTILLIHSLNYSFIQEIAIL